MRKLIVFLVVILSVSCSAQSSSSKVLSQEDFKTHVIGKDVQLVDVRTPGEYKAGKIDDAINIDYMAADFKAKMAKLDKSKPIYIYCQAGGRSASAAKILVEMGFKKVFDLSGGYGSYKK
jgi:rhodanese-related sulfurtransferase